ncbi:hypothetical protein D3C78_1338010 [compost metagenome]
MGFGQQEKFPINGIAQLRQFPVAKLWQQHHAIGLNIADNPRATGDQLVRPAVFGLVRDKADLALL